MIYQLGERTFPPLKTISNTNLPRPASSFIGREREREDVVRELRDGVRLLTLTGPGGSGKTRLALEAATELVPTYKAGVFWVGLAALREPSLVTDTIAQTLGARDGLAGHIGDREMLLLLDNLEQVIEAAPDLSALVSACPNLALLVTSRELLRVQGEVEYSVLPLASSEAVSLFCERSRLEATAEIAELCSRLDDLPLAVELAAARSRALSPAQILERLSERLDLLSGGRDAEMRQQTLRATIEWSYFLLSEDEQHLFRALSVFAGGCTLEAAEEVAVADLDTLQSLVEKSLLRFTNERYWMLETIREFAVERLQQLAEADDRRETHARWYLELAWKAHGELRGAAAAEWLSRLDDDLENLRRAIGWAQEHDERLEVELVERAWYFLAVRGLGREARSYLAHAREAARSASLDEVGLLYGAAVVALEVLGDSAAAERLLEARLELGRARGDALVIAASLYWLAMAIRRGGNQERARTVYLEAAEVARECGDTMTLVGVAHGLGEIALEKRDAATARQHFERELELAGELSNSRSEAIALRSLTQVALLEGDTKGAAALLERALRLVGALGDKEGVVACLMSAAELVAQRGETACATRLLASADALREEAGYSLAPAEEDLRARIAAAVEEDAALVAAQSKGDAMTLDEAIEFALLSIVSPKTPDEQAPTR